jgi:hypothetical protein
VLPLQRLLTRAVLCWPQLHTWAALHTWTGSSGVLPWQTSVAWCASTSLAGRALLALHTWTDYNGGLRWRTVVERPCV